MAALGYLRRAGLAVEANGDRLRLRPADRITDAVRQFVRDHRAELLAELSAELLAELSAANDAQAAPEPLQAPEATSDPKRAAWRITRAGQPIGYMVGQPMTYDEALTIARWRWADADILES